MNFFRGEKEMRDYFHENELDPATTFGLTLTEALAVSRETFERR